MPASRWLLRFDHEMEGYASLEGTVPSDRYLKCLNMLLTEDAAEWAPMALLPNHFIASKADSI